MPLDEDDQQRLWAAVFGNGHPGLDERVSTMERALFHNAATGDPGLVADVKVVRRFMERLLTIWQVIAWLIGVAGLGVLVKLFVPGA